MSDAGHAVPPTSTRNIGWIVIASVAFTFLLACLLTIVMLAGGPEPVISAALLFTSAAGAALLGAMSTRWSDQPQRWAWRAAACLAACGVVLLLWPRVVTTEAFAWVAPLLLVALAVWMTMRVRVELQSRVRAWVAYPVIACLGLAGVAGALETVREFRERPTAPAHGRLIDVGGGRRVYLDCTGSGAPVVVMVAGFSGGASSWGWIAPEVARTTRVCTYDRAGRGWSDPVGASQDAEGVASDVATALTGAGETGPYLLVGHSFGGLYMRAFAQRYPERTAAMVLLDATDPLMFTKVPPYPGIYDIIRRASGIVPTLARFGVARLVNLHAFDSLPPSEAEEERVFGATARHARSLRDEWAAAPVAMEQAGKLVTLGARPLMVVTAVKEAQEGWIPLQDVLVSLSSNSSHWSLPDATHSSIVEDRSVGAIATQAILEVVAAVRNPSPLPRH